MSIQQKILSVDPYNTQISNKFAKSLKSQIIAYTSDIAIDTDTEPTTKTKKFLTNPQLLKIFQKAVLLKNHCDPLPDSDEKNEHDVDKFLKNLRKNLIKMYEQVGDPDRFYRNFVEGFFEKILE